MATVSERIAIIITGDAIGGVNAFKQVGAASSDALGKMSVSERAVGALGTKLGGLSAITVGLGADVAALKFGEHLVNEFAGATAGVRDFQRVSGATAEDSSKLVAASKVLGVDTDKLGTSMFRLAHNLDGGKDALAKYGVEVAHTRGGAIDLSATLLNIADAVARVGPGAQADALAFAAFGRQATSLLPVLLRGRDGLQELFDAAAKHHEIFSQSDLEKGRQFTLATKDLQQALTGLEIEGGKALIPFATSLVKGLEPAVNFFGVIARGVQDIHSLNRFVPKQLGGDAGKAASGQTDLAAAALAASNSASQEAAAAKEAQTAIDGFTKASDAATSAQKSVASASRSVLTATREEDTARDSLNKLQRAGAVSAVEVAQAEKGVAAAAKATADAQKSEAAATQRVADAQQSVLDAQAAQEAVKQGASPEDVAKAQFAASRAQRDTQRSVLALADAQDKKNSLVSIGLVGAGQQVSTARDQITADLDLADAMDGTTLAGFAAKDAQDALTKVQQQGKEGSDDLKKAQEDLKQKQKDLTQALDDQAAAHQLIIDKQQEQIDAGAALTKAQAGDPDFAEKIRDAQQKVADAHQNTVDQINAEKDAVEALNIAEGKLATARIDRGNAVPAVPAGVSGPVLDRSTVNSTFGTGLTVPVAVQIDGRAVATATVTHTADELAKLAKRNGLS